MYVKIPIPNNTKISSSLQFILCHPKQSNIAQGIKIRPACAGIHGGDIEDQNEGPYVDSEDEMGMSSDSESDEETDDDNDNDRANNLMDNQAKEAQDKSKKKKSSKNNDTQEEEIDPTGGGISRKATVSTDKESTRDSFMHALEVEAQCRLTWNKEPILCSKFFGCAHSPEMGMSGDGEEWERSDIATPNGNDGTTRPRSTSDAAEMISGGGKGYTFFFLRALPVPPSRFRPPVIMGNMTVEHSQNFYLSKVLELNARIRSAFATIHDLSSQEEELKRSDSDDVEKRLKKIRMDRDKGQASMLEIWVDLQTTVNCFMDSSRDPKGTSSNAPNGIRQLLEKKEGIFRK